VDDRHIAVGVRDTEGLTLPMEPPVENVWMPVPTMISGPMLIRGLDDRLGRLAEAVSTLFSGQAPPHRPGRSPLPARSAVSCTTCIADRQVADSSAIDGRESRPRISVSMRREINSTA
jgi:hypothetical protein